MGLKHEVGIGTYVIKGAQGQIKNIFNGLKADFVISSVLYNKLIILYHVRKSYERKLLAKALASAKIVLGFG